VFSRGTRWSPWTGTERYSHWYSGDHAACVGTYLIKRFYSCWNDIRSLWLLEWMSAEDLLSNLWCWLYWPRQQINQCMSYNIALLNEWISKCLAHVPQYFYFIRTYKHLTIIQRVCQQDLAQPHITISSPSVDVSLLNCS